VSGTLYPTAWLHVLRYHASNADAAMLSAFRKGGIALLVLGIVPCHMSASWRASKR
jgi:hypothetical protein